MKNLVSAFCSVVLLVLSGCVFGNSTLATINDEPVKKNELVEWAGARKINPDIIKTDPVAQENMLRQLVLEKIISAKAAAEGFDRAEDYIRIKETVYRNFLSSYYNSRYFRDLKFNEQCADVSIIRIYYKGKVNGTDYKAKAALINGTILPALKEGKEFSSLAAEYSGDSARKRGGRLGLVPVKMLEEDLQSVVLSLADGTYTEKPVKIGNSLCLVRLDKMVDINEKNIEDYITDRVTRGRITAFVRKEAAERAEIDLKKGPGVVSRISSAVFRSDDEFLFSVDKTSYRVGDIKKILNIFYLLKKHEVINKFPAEEIRFTAERIFREAVISSEAIRLGYDKDPDFQNKWFYIERATLSGMYKSRYIVQNVKVDRGEVDAAYRKIALMNKKGRSPRLNATAGREAAYSQVYRSKFRKLKNDWEASLLAENRYTVIK